jgi:hypothetical protein
MSTAAADKMKLDDVRRDLAAKLKAGIERQSIDGSLIVLTKNEAAVAMTALIQASIRHT